MKLRLRKAKVSDLPFLIIFSYATSIAPFLDAAYRNYFLILVTLTTFIIIFAATRIRFGSDLPLLICAMLYPYLLVISSGTTGNFVTVTYTFILACGYLALVTTLKLEQVTALRVRIFLGWLIKLFAIVSIIQLFSSMLGLPVLNGLASRGIWNQNSLATEPSNAGRVMSMCMLVYLILWRSQAQELASRKNTKEVVAVFVAFAVVIFLSGSALAVAAAPLAVILAFRMRWGLLLLAAAALLWPVAYQVDNEAVQRVVRFVGASGGLDVSQMAETDTSATVRVAALILWWNNLQTVGLDFWFGGGFGSLDFFTGKIPGVAEGVMVGFIPGYWMVFGLVGAILFLWVFVIRFVNTRTAPVLVMFIVFFSTVGWNTQVFWFGLMLLRVCHTFARSASTITLTHSAGAAAADSVSVVYHGGAIEK